MGIWTKLAFLKESEKWPCIIYYFSLLQVLEGGHLGSQRDIKLSVLSQIHSTKKLFIIDSTMRNVSDMIVLIANLIKILYVYVFVTKLTVFIIAITVLGNF